MQVVPCGMRERLRATGKINLAHAQLRNARELCEWRELTANSGRAYDWKPESIGRIIVELYGKEHSNHIWFFLSVLCHCFNLPCSYIEN
jgi:hypothetical protein